MTCVCAIADEISFWFDDASSNPDREIIDAIRPSLSTTDGMLVCIGSPHARRGQLWLTYQRHFGAGGDPLILVAQGASRDLNPNLPQAVVDRALDLDEAVARAEYLAEFRRDLVAFVSREAVESCVRLGCASVRRCSMSAMLASSIRATAPIPWPCASATAKAA